MYRLFKPFLFLLNPERAHHLTFFLLDLAALFPPTRWLLRRWYTAPQAGPVEALGLRFPNGVGLAAGFDKDGRHIEGLACLGFGFIEVGTVTPLPQAGNPKPRLFRLPADHALINRMGFNNDGLQALAQRLERLRRRGGPAGGVLIGGNIGKNKATPNEAADTDYLACFDALHTWVDYFVVNVSSPNTPGLRALQEREPLTRLLALLQERNRALPQPRPILLKIAPDLSDAQLDDIAAIVRDTGLAGVIATNTTIARSGLNTPAIELDAMGAGGLSGAPLRDRASQVIHYLRSALGPEPVIVGVGGIDSPEAAREKIEAGANLVQVYTGLIYAGPNLVRRCAEALAE